MTTSKSDPEDLPLFIKEAKNKAARYCAYQERTQQQVREKLYSLGLHHENVELLLSSLIAEGYVNEERFAKQYAGGKFRMKKWGRLKIIQGLRGKGLTERCIDKGLLEIDKTDYINTLKTLALNKYEHLQDENKQVKLLKTFNYLKAKGYEFELINQILDEF